MRGLTLTVPSPNPPTSSVGGLGCFIWQLFPEFPEGEHAPAQVGVDMGAGVRGAMHFCVDCPRLSSAGPSVVPSFSVGFAWHTLRGRTVRCARAVPALCEKLAVLHHREFGKFRRLKGRH